MANLVRMPQSLREKDAFGVFDDFLWYISPHMWTSLVADAGTSASVSDAVGGRLAIAGGAADNDEAAARSTTEVFLVADGKPMFCEGRLQYTEANVDDANVAFGFGSAIGANWLADNGAGPRTSGNQFMIYKVDGGTVWRCQSRNGSTVNDTVSTKTAGGAAFQTLRIEIADFDATNVEVTYFVDGDPLKDANGTVISHRLPIASSTEMNVGAYVKVGAVTQVETLVVDYIAAYQAR